MFVPKHVNMCGCDLCATCSVWQCNLHSSIVCGPAKCVSLSCSMCLCVSVSMCLTVRSPCFSRVLNCVCFCCLRVHAKLAKWQVAGWAVTILMAVAACWMCVTDNQKHIHIHTHIHAHLHPHTRMRTHTVRLLSLCWILLSSVGRRRHAFPVRTH